MEPSGLGLLFQNLGPATAAMVAGQRDAQAEKDAGLAQLIQQQELEKSTLANQFTRDNNPQRLQNQALLNINQGYENDVNSVKSASALKNKDSQVALDGAQLQEKQLKIQAERGGQLGEMGRQLAPQLAQIPVGQRQQAVMGFLKQAGIDPNNPTVQGIFGQLKNVPEDRWPQLLNDYSNKMIEGSAKYKQEMDVAKMQRDSAEKVAAGNNATSLAVARMNQDGQNSRAQAKAGGKVQNILGLVRSGKLSYEKAASALALEAELNPDLSDEERTQYKDMAGKMEQANLSSKAAINNGKVDSAGLIGAPALSVKPALGGGPKMGTAENPIVLK